MRTKPRLSFWQIWNMNFGFLGIQFGYALQNANVSRIFETLGAKVDDIPILWVAAPVTGLIMQPIIGHYSDNTWGKFGRRRPYFLIGAILASIALILMPNSPHLWIAAGMLWIMDASINVSMEPFRAFVGDMLPEEQRTKGFTMQSFFIGIGAVVASALPYVLTNWFGVSNTSQEGVIPDSVKWSFYLGASAFLLAVLWTVFSTKEYSPEELKSFEEIEDKSDRKEVEINMHQKLKKSSYRLGLVFSLIGAVSVFIIYFYKLKLELYILGIGLLAFGLLELLVYFLQRKTLVKTGLTEIFNDFNNMPKTMKQLAVVQFFSWFALFAMWIYTVSGITSQKYDMKIDLASLNAIEYSIVNIPDSQEFLDENGDDLFADKRDVLNDISILKEKVIEKGAYPISIGLVKYILDEDRLNYLNLKESIIVRLQSIQEEYNTGADWVGVGFAVYNGFAAIFAFFLIWLSRVTNRKIAHMFSLTVGALSFVSLFFITNTMTLLIPFIGIGLTWASILAMPYAILTGSLPQDKMGVYMGIFNFFIVIPQILAASILGFMIIELFNGESVYAFLIGGVSFFLAGLSVLFVKDVKC